MLNLKDVTLVAVTSVKLKETERSIKRCCENINFGDVKFIIGSESNYDDFPTIKSNSLLNSVDEYSRFIVYDLWKYIETSHCLIIQYDGFVNDHNSWRDDFLNYCYIGAPWPLPTDSFSYRDSFNNIVRVGNGGFSLRSKKLLELPTKLNLSWEPFHGYYNEDGFFVCKNRHIFLKNGCNFADIDVAKYFSRETDLPENVGINTFGVHGKRFL